MKLYRNYIKFSRYFFDNFKVYKETQTTAFIYCYIDTVVGLSIVKFHIFAVKRKQLELWKALTIL